MQVPRNRIIDWQWDFGFFQFVAEEGMVRCIRHKRTNSVRSLPEAFVCRVIDIPKKVMIEMNWLEADAYLYNMELEETKSLGKNIFREEVDRPYVPPAVNEKKVVEKNKKVEKKRKGLVANMLHKQRNAMTGKK
eukprot:1822545-Lingulodinium_polyedra.AAC.1